MPGADQALAFHLLRISPISVALIPSLLICRAAVLDLCDKPVGRGVIILPARCLVCVEQSLVRYMT
jgi:hypothetical protein